MWKGFKVIDADAHMHEPRDMWDKYVEAPFNASMPKVVGMNGVFFIYDFMVSTKERISSTPPPDTAWAELEKTHGEAFHSWWSAASRLKAMDTHGWDIQVLLPTGVNGNYAYTVALKDLKLGAAMCRAYNNWAHDYCSADPKRLKFCAVLPGSDTGEMVKEARRAVEKLGAVSVRNPLLPAGRWMHEPEYDAFWATACELDFPISAHGEYRHLRSQPFHGQMQNTTAETRDALTGLDHALGFPCDNMATLGHFIFSGILERFPALRIGVLESNAGWVPFWLGRMDEHTHGRNARMGAIQPIPRRPSEYFSRQCYVSCDSDETALHYAAEYLKGDNLVWNTDYPHPDAVRPEQALPLFEAQAISAENKRKILWDNAIKLYGNRILA